MNTPYLTIRRHLSCCGQVLTVSAFATECQPNPLEIIRQILDRKLEKHVCEDLLPAPSGRPTKPTKA